MQVLIQKDSAPTRSKTVSWCAFSMSGSLCYCTYGPYLLVVLIYFHNFPRLTSLSSLLPQPNNLASLRARAERVFIGARETMKLCRAAASPTYPTQPNNLASGASIHGCGHIPETRQMNTGRNATNFFRTKRVWLPLHKHLNNSFPLSDSDGV